MVPVGGRAALSFEIEGHGAGDFEETITCYADDGSALWEVPLTVRFHGATASPRKRPGAAP